MGKFSVVVVLLVSVCSGLVLIGEAWFLVVLEIFCGVAASLAISLVVAVFSKEVVA